MAYEPIMFRCDSCNVRIVLRASEVVGSHPQPKLNRKQDSGEEHGVLFEGICPKCREPFEIWQARADQMTHVTDLQFERPDVFTGKGSERAEQVIKNKEAREAAQKEAERQREIRKAEAAERQRQQAEERRARLEAQRAAARAKRSDDWDDDGDYGDGGRSPNDDRSDSMNPNNDAYWSSRGG